MKISSKENDEPFVKVKSPSKKLFSIDFKIRQVQSRLAKLECQKNGLLGGTQIQCAGCHRFQEIRHLVYLQIMRFNREAFDERWENVEGQFRCSECGATTRLRWNPEIEKLKYHFASISEIKG